VFRILLLVVASLSHLFEAKAYLNTAMFKVSVTYMTTDGKKAGYGFSKQKIAGFEWD
jgi:hypothetical protein